MNDVVREISNRTRLLLKKVELLLNDFLTSSEWIRLLSKTLCTELKVLFGVITNYRLFIIIQIISLKLMALSEKISHKTSLLVELLKFSVDNFTMKQFFNPSWYL